MKQRKTDDFFRALRAFAASEGLEMEIEQTGSGPTYRIILFKKNGHELIRVHSFIMRADQKEVSPATARRLLARLRDRLELEAAKIASREITENIEHLIEWLRQWFGS